MFPYLRALAHEMASPITQILGYTQMVIEMAPEGIDCIEDLNHVERAAGEARNHVGMLSRMSRRESESSRGNLLDLWTDVSRLARIVSYRNSSQLSCLANPPPNLEEVEGNPWLLRAGLLATIGASFASPKASLHLETSDTVAAWKVVAEKLHRGYGEPDPERPHALEWGLEVLKSQGASISEDSNSVAVHLNIVELE